MEEAKNAVIAKLWGMLNAICSLSDTSHIAHDKLLYLRIFKQADVRLGGDAISDAIYSRYGHQMKESHKDALKDLVSSWREWSFFREHYEIV